MQQTPQERIREICRRHGLLPPEAKMVEDFAHGDPELAEGMCKEIVSRADIDKGVKAEWIRQRHGGQT